MAENPFTNYQQFIDRPGRNSDDLSYDINSSYAAGTLYPCGIWDVNAGESFRIKSAFGLKFLPMPYPIQTRMRANLYFYYVRNRNIYDGWKDFIYQNKSADQVPMPTIKRPASDREFWRTGGIMDHLGCPTTIARKGGSGLVTVSVSGIQPVLNGESAGSGGSNSGNSGKTLFVAPASLSNNYKLFTQYSRPYFLWTKEHPKDFVPGFFPVGSTANLSVLGCTFSSLQVAGSDVNSLSEDDAYNYRAHGYRVGVFYQPPLKDENGVAKLTFINCVATSDRSERTVRCMLFTGDPSKVRSYVADGSREPLADFVCMSVIDLTGVWLNESTFVVTLKEELIDAIEAVVGEGNCYYLFIGETVSESALKDAPLINSAFLPLFNTSSNLGNVAQLMLYGSSIIDIADYPESNPFAGDNPKLPLSSLPLRVYESVYNAWFRNERLEPLMIDGVAEYNKFCPNTTDGPDDYPYTLHQRNWESDFLTTALPTPQQGIAPVVGVTGLSDIQIDDEGTIRNFHAEVAEDGETIVGGSFNEPGASSGAKRTIQQMITAGFTINDFRNVNALQRWVENNIRRGLKYRDQVLANTGVKVRYDELDMPEFIGGFSRPVNVASITQTAPGGEAGVGDYAGQASAFGENSHNISHFCDEAGWIIGILCIVPEPVYSQLLPKYFLRKSPLDFFHPAFNHIGMQPITYEEVCPLQVYNENPDQTAEGGVRFTDVFGYQRPWYDQLARVNEVHGLLRTDLRNYVMNRTFDSVPELGGDFIHIDPDQINDVFSVSLPGKDICVGQIIHQAYAKRQISLFGQPKIQ